MIRYRFKCTLLSDIVINEKAGTDGPQSSLDYIPGSNFMGIVANKMYKDAKDERDQLMCYKMFHSGDLVFSDAHISMNGDRFLRRPASWATLKNGSDADIILHHNLSKEDHIKNFKEGRQYKQTRTGYFSPLNKQFTQINKQFTLKSAYDAEKRRAKDSSLFGYESIPQGVDMIFYVESENKDYLERAKEILIGEKRVGRSKSAQYGLVEISFLGEDADVQFFDDRDKRELAGNQIIVYAESDICIINQYGSSVLAPNIGSYLNLNNDWNVCWEKSQVLTRSYAPWNGKRFTRDADRIVISKGSVFVLDNQSNSGLSKSVEKNLFYRIGEFKSEGLGGVLINPDFLMEEDLSHKKLESITLHESQLNIQRFESNDDYDDNVFKFLKRINEQEEQEALIYSACKKFRDKEKEKYRSGITNSQWGGVRDIAKRSSDKEELMKYLFIGKDSYLMHGVNAEKWKEKSRRDILKDAIENNFKGYLSHGSSIGDENLPSVVEKLAALFQKKNK
ncbi:MAG: hypothetical protein RBT65_14345 [Methanolobus sp.]|nr:hypothetical protein [Methanolobus sp.]